MGMDDSVVNDHTSFMAWSWNNVPRSARIGVITIALLGLVYGVYTLTLHRAAPDLVRAKARIKTQRAEILSLTSRLEDSTLQQKVAEREADVIRRANQLLRTEESERQAEINRLQGELEFYQRLAGTSGTQSGLAVYHLELSSTGSERVFRYMLTLTQNLRRSAIISGSIRMEIEGTRDDQPVTLPWSQLKGNNGASPEFRFKYFQQLEGYIEIPEDFKPARLQVTLDTKGQGIPISRGFDWSDLMSPAGPAPVEDAAPGEPERELEPSGSGNEESR